MAAWTKTCMEGIVSHTFRDIIRDIMRPQRLHTDSLDVQWSQYGYSVFICFHTIVLCFPKHSIHFLSEFFFPHSFSSLSTTVMTSLTDALIGCTLNLRGGSRFLIGQTLGIPYHTPPFLLSQENLHISMFLHAGCIRQKHS